MDCLGRSILADHNASVRSAYLRIPAVNTTMAIFHRWGLGNDSRNSTMAMPNQVAQPQLIVLEGVGGGGVGAAEVEEEEGSPEGGEVAVDVLFARLGLVVEEVAERQGGDVIGAQVGSPEDEAQQRVLAPLPEEGDEDEDDLQAEAEEDQDADFFRTP
ncbi:hypothetical protein C4D60_Mb09t10810 [Musa balbisiana]|uniref:Uncharacterized protein n=1 Tax=Musa balbisiana TaxID=52838 RepID=A0A4S8IFK6_MUSBA|nr:hypothetical protein C4D60_Mb09t10810 [Musa balbisiana]